MIRKRVRLPFLLLEIRVDINNTRKIADKCHFKDTISATIESST